jgi:hypothetical protein
MSPALAAEGWFPSPEGLFPQVVQPWGKKPRAALSLLPQAVGGIPVPSIWSAGGFDVLGLYLQPIFTVYL